MHPVMWVVILSLGGTPLRGPVPSVVGSRPQQPRPSQPAHQAPTDQRGTEQSPLVVKTLPPTKTGADAKQEAQDRQNQTAQQQHTRFLSYITLAVLILEAGVFVYQARILGQSVDATKDATAATREALQGTQRPWVKADVSIADTLKIDDNAATTAVNISLTNVGRSPAIYVWVQTRLIAVTSQMQPDKELRRMSERARHETRPADFGWGTTLFPDDTDVLNARITLDKKEIAAGLGQPSMTPDSFGLALIGFVEYQFSMDSQRHQTGFTFWIFRQDGEPIRAGDRLAMSVRLSPIIAGHYAD
jgi:hypothetical protein